MGDDASIRSDDQGLRNRFPPVHQRRCGLAVGPAEAESEIEVSRESLDAIGRRVRILGRQTDELYAPSSELFPHLLVFRNFPPARATPRRPQINHNDPAAEVSEAKGAVVDRQELPLKNAFRQRSQLKWQDGRAIRQYNW